jgi:hypothetical protein
MSSENGDSTAPVQRLVRLLSFRELALRFLDDVNPKPERAIVIADAIVSFDEVDSLDRLVPMRHHAHAFVDEALRVIEYRSAFLSGRQFGRWMVVWNDQFGVVK